MMLDWSFITHDHVMMTHDLFQEQNAPQEMGRNQEPTISQKSEADEVA